MARRLARGDVHLFPFDPPHKRRPVVILTRENVVNSLSWVTVAPISSTIRGAESEVLLNIEEGMKGPCAVNLQNIVTVPQQRLGPRVASLGPDRMKEVCAALRFSLGCD